MGNELDEVNAEINRLNMKLAELMKRKQKLLEEQNNQQQLLLED